MTAGFQIVRSSESVPSFDSDPASPFLFRGVDPLKVELKDYKGSLEELERGRTPLPNFDFEESCRTCDGDRLSSCLLSVAWARETYLKIPAQRTPWMDQRRPQS